jgi:2-dehydro-3-deoxyphosphogluconate aldolase/(4S)-4-hydroxy-2-oxoglutarate aldolase
MGLFASDVAEALIRTGLVAVVRSSRSDQLLAVAEALAAGGINAVEITFTVPDAPAVIREVKKALGDRVLVGAGSLLDSPSARLAVLAGADFLVSPILSSAVMRTGLRYGVCTIPGAWSPTEVARALELGALLVKIFPADVGGPAYLKVLRGPFPQVRLMPTGGIGLAQVGDFVRAGAACLGVGSALVSSEIVAKGQWDRLQELARAFRNAVDQARRAST